ncbi:MAG: hypothetical protein J0I74_13315 [Rhodanobacter sp.]|nr:hypothetical protein [Rhodanobacter sp.]
MSAHDLADDDYAFEEDALSEYDAEMAVDRYVFEAIQGGVFIRQAPDPDPYKYFLMCKAQVLDFVGRSLEAPSLLMVAEEGAV